MSGCVHSGQLANERARAICGENAKPKVILRMWHRAINLKSISCHSLSNQSIVRFIASYRIVKEQQQQQHGPNQADRQEIDRR
jgi:hypothetical protein